MRQSVAAVALLVPIALAGCATTGRTPGVRSGEVDPGPAVAHAPECIPIATVVGRWQMALGLGGWGIEVFCQPGPPEVPELLGLTRWNLFERRAAMWINPDGPDQELTVIHELLHLPFASSCAADSELVREQQLRAIARAIRR